MNAAKVLFLLLLTRIGASFSARILAIYHFQMKSHYAFAQPLLMKLAERGHDVTVYTPFLKPKNEIIPNYREFDISTCFPRVMDYGDVEFMRAAYGESLVSNALAFPTVNALSVDDFQACEPLMLLLNSTEKYDLFMMETFNSDAMVMFANKFKVPFIVTTPNVLTPYQAARVANAANPSYVPTFAIVTVKGYVSSMNFFQRVVNSITYVSTIILYYMVTMRKENEVIRHFLGPSAPSLYESVKNTSLIICNSDSIINPGFPMVPNVIQASGMQMKPAKKLPKDIEKFLNESAHGVVYFSMGSTLRCSSFPPEKLNAFLYTFSKLPQRVLWKLDDGVLPGKSENMMIVKWMPQRDILAHPNVKLFISHGGLLGTSEAVYEGVPILGIPIFGDQRTNLKNIEMKGAGETLEYDHISNEVVLEKVTRLLNNPEYKKNAADLSIKYRDKPMSPLDTAVYWTEYVIRHRGAPHLRTAAVHMPWHQYLLLDVIAFLIIVIVSALVIICYSVTFLWRILFGKRRMKEGRQTSSKELLSKKTGRKAKETKTKMN